jgi:hypothetical protein
MNNVASGYHIGQPVRRKEDLRLITGQGCFSDDVNLPQQAYAVMLRSPHAHARLRAIDTQHALALPGVLAVLTGADMIPDGIQPIPHQPFNTHPADIQMVNTDGSDIFAAPQYPLALHKVRLNYVSPESLRLPAALPFFLAGLRISGGLALVGAVVAEFVAGSGAVQGLAWRILESGNRLQTDRMFAALAVLAALGLVLHGAVQALERRLLAWWSGSGPAR